MQRIINAAILAFFALVLATPAEARHRHYSNHRHYERQVSLPQSVVCDQWGCHGGGRIERATKARRVIRTARRPVLDANGNGASFGGLISRARAYNGMTAGQIGLRRHTQWCMAFLRHIGVNAPDDRAISALRLPHVSPQVGAIAVWPHHVGIVTGFAGGYPVIISGNSNGRRVYEGTYPRRPIAYVSG